MKISAIVAEEEKKEEIKEPPEFEFDRLSDLDFEEMLMEQDMNLKQAPKCTINVIRIEDDANE